MRAIISSYRRLSRTSLRVRRTRSGFTLIELMVATALLLIVTMMAFSGFRYLTAVMNRTITTTTARENLSVVMDQLTKELREVTTVNDGIGGATQDGARATYGVTLPTSSTTADTTRGIKDVLTVPANYEMLGSDIKYAFLTNVDNLPNGIVLEFFTVDTNGYKHRIRYGLTSPKTSLGAYNGLAQSFWAVSTYEPCEITYCNSTWDSTTSPPKWLNEVPQPMTDQVVTGFTVTRPSWSPNVLQITLEAQVRGLSGTGYSTVRLIGLVTVRQ